MILVRPNEHSLVLKNLSETQMQSIINLLTSDPYKADYEFAEYPKWDRWSERIPLSLDSRRIPKDKIVEYFKSGVYEIYHKDDLIYIGETRSSTRNGMWARRGDFRSTVKGGSRIKNPYGNGTKFLEVFGYSEMSNVSHRFHYVHPQFCKQAELELLKTYYKKHNKLPILHDEIDINKTINKINTDDTPTLENFL